MRLIITGMFVVTCIAAGPAGADGVKNGGFESVIENAPEGWEVQAGRGNAYVETRPFWHKLSRTFNTAEYKHLRVYVRLQVQPGTVWFDDVSVFPLELKDPGFEEAKGDDFLRWGQDNVGGTIFCDRSVARTGKASVRIHNTDKRQSRLWQDFECKPNQEVTLSVWVRAPERLNAYAEVYGMDEQGRHGRFWATGRPSGYSPPQELGQRSLALRAERDGKVVVSQDVALSLRGRACAKCVAALEDCPNGAWRFAVADARTGRLLAQSAARSGTSKSWMPERIDFTVPQHGQVRLLLTLQGPAELVRVDNVRIEPFSPRFPVQKFTPKPERPELVWRLGQKPQTNLPDDHATRQAWLMLLESLQARENSPSQTPEISIRISEPAAKTWPDTERYSLSIAGAGVTITAGSPVGVRWALVTLFGLGEVEGQTWHAPACEIEDRPDMKLRMTYRAGIPYDAGERQQFCRRLMRLKMNGLVIEDGAFYDIHNAELRSRIVKVFDDIRSYGIEPIPELQSFGHAGSQLHRDPRLAEGKWIRNERITLHESKATPLAQKNVIRTKATDVALTSVDGKTRYVRGEDYEVVDGTIAWLNPEKAKPFAVRRLPGSRIPDGATALAGYDVIARGASYCPSEPAVYNLCLPALKEVIRTLRTKYVHIGHDEPTRMIADSRCARRGMTETALIAEDLKRWNDAAHEADPSVRLMMWSDPINPFHNGRRVLTDPEGFEQIPKDIIQCVWFYGASQPLEQGYKSLEFFSKRGFQTTGSPWFNVTCAENWGRVGWKAVKKDWPFLGIFYTSWSRRWAALEKTAAVTWKAPK